MTHEQLRDRADDAARAYDRAVWQCEQAREAYQADPTPERMDALALATDAKARAYAARSKATRAIRQANIPREP